MRSLCFSLDRLWPSTHKSTITFLVVLSYHLELNISDYMYFLSVNKVIGWKADFYCFCLISAHISPFLFIFHSFWEMFNPFHRNQCLLIFQTYFWHRFTWFRTDSIHYIWSHRHLFHEMLRYDVFHLYFWGPYPIGIY